MNKRLLLSSLVFFVVLICFVAIDSLIHSGANTEDKFSYNSDITNEIPEDDKKAPEPSHDENIISSETKEENIKNSEPNSKKKIAIIMDDLGYGHEKKYNLFNRIKGSKITMSIIPGLPNSIKSEEEAVKNGFEVMAHIPMQAIGKRNKTEKTIRVDMNHEELYNTLENMLKDFKHIKGANNHQGSKATSSKKTMLNVITFLKNRGLFFVDSLTSSQSVVKEVSSVLGVKYRSRDIFIDNIADKKYIMGQLKKVQNIAMKHEVAIGICHVRKTTIDVLEKYIKEIESSSEFELIFVSELYKDKKKYSLSKL